MDLNLYPVFLEILRHGSVTRAADTLGLTQPAASNALARLRGQLGDPLFIRTKSGMQPTDYAKTIAPAIERAIGGLNGIAQGNTLEVAPLADLTGRFAVIMSDLEETLFLSDLLVELNAKAPGLTLEVRPYQRATLREDIERGKADFVLANVTVPLKNVRSRDITFQDFVCISRHGHPGIGRHLEIDQYLRQGHILVAPDRGGTRGVIDSALKHLGRKRRVVCSVPHFLLACMLAANSDYLLTVPRLLAEKAARHFDLTMHELPIEAAGFTVGLHWHRARDNDPEHAALRGFLVDTLTG